MLEKEFQYYVKAQPELVKRYDGRHLVIVGNGVAGDFASRDEALNYVDGRYAPGTFLIQLCTPGDSAYTRKFYSRRVSFHD